MNKLLIGVVALPFLTGIAVAGQPKVLSDKQMDTVTAGGTLADGCIGGCYLPPMIGPEFPDFHWPGGYITYGQYEQWFGLPNSMK